MNDMWEHWRFIEELRYRLTVCCDELCSGSDRTRVTQVCQSHLSSAFTGGRRHPLIGWEGNDPSCCHSAIRTQTAHLHTGDLSLLQSVQKDSDIQDWSTWYQWPTLTSCSLTFNGPLDKKSRFWSLVLIHHTATLQSSRLNHLNTSTLSVYRDLIYETDTQLTDLRSVRVENMNPVTAEVNWPDGSRCRCVEGIIYITGCRDKSELGDMDVAASVNQSRPV